MTRPMLHDKIQPHHLGRRAVIYLRQSSDKQVRQNKESQRLQYGLRDRAVALGWTQVEVLDMRPRPQRLARRRAAGRL